MIFRVLCDFGYEDLAIKMITRDDEPSYGCMIRDGLTTLGECVRPPYDSLNHHFWGDISALMIEYFAGIRINPEKKGADTVAIAPVFPTDMSLVQAHHMSVKGMIAVRFDKQDDGRIILTLVIPEEIDGTIVAPKGYTVSGCASVPAKTGVYCFQKA